MIEVMVTTGAKLQANHHHQQTNSQFLQAGRPSYHPTNSVRALVASSADAMQASIQPIKER